MVGATLPVDLKNSSHCNGVMGDGQVLAHAFGIDILALGMSV